MTQLEVASSSAFSIAMTDGLDAALRNHLLKVRGQEDLAFVRYRWSSASGRGTAILSEPIFPEDGDRLQAGNVSFTSDYVLRVLRLIHPGEGLAFLHSHLGPGWQRLSIADTVAEQDRLASVISARAHHPLVGMTLGTDGHWSGRRWLKDETGWNAYRAETVRVVGRRLRSWRSTHAYAVDSLAQEATIAAWGPSAQEEIANTHVGIVGLGSVGSIVAEALARIGVTHISLIDFDRLETNSLDRTLGAAKDDVGLRKVDIAQREAERAAVSPGFRCDRIPYSLLSRSGVQAALSCDVLVSCVDRPWPRHVLNQMAYGHLIPVIDGGIQARVNPDGTPLHVDWRIHAVGPGRACLYCLGALRRSDVALDMAGMLESPDYVAGLPENERSALERRNVFLFSLSVAAHLGLQLAGVITGLSRIGAYRPQMYHSYPGSMEVLEPTECVDDCEVLASTAGAPEFQFAD